MRLAVLTSHPIQYQAPLFRILSQRPGIELTVLFCHEHGAAPTFDAQFGRVIHYDVPLLAGYSHRFLSNIAPTPALSPMGQVNPGVLMALARNEFDALVVHGYTTLTSLLAVLGPRRLTRILMRGDTNLVSHRPLVKRAIKQLFLRTLFARVDHFLPIGSLNQAYYASYGVPAERMTLAPFSVDNDHFAAGSLEARQDPTTERRRLGIPPDIPLFLFCGKLISRKQPLELLRAFARVRAHVPCGLVYVGDGALAVPLDDEIRRLGLADTVHCLGFRNQSELPSIYGACDVLVLPSDSEPWGLVVNEAMASGMAVVASNCVGAGPDLLDPTCLFQPHDMDSVVPILHRLASRSEDLALAKRRAKERIQQWGLAQTADGFIHGAELALGTHGRRRCDTASAA